MIEAFGKTDVGRRRKLKTRMKRLQQSGRKPLVSDHEIDRLHSLHDRIRGCNLEHSPHVRDPFQIADQVV